MRGQAGKKIKCDVLHELTFGTRKKGSPKGLRRERGLIIRRAQNSPSHSYEGKFAATGKEGTKGGGGGKSTKTIRFKKDGQSLRNLLVQEKEGGIRGRDFLTW